AVYGRRDPFVLRRLNRLIGLDILVSLAVAIGVKDERRPALGLHLVAGLLEQLPVQPANHAAGGAAGAGPQRVVGVLGKDQVMGGEAGADERELARRRIVHGQMAV